MANKSRKNADTRCSLSVSYVSLLVSFADVLFFCFQFCSVFLSSNFIAYLPFQFLILRKKQQRHAKPTQNISFAFHLESNFLIVSPRRLWCDATTDVNISYETFIFTRYSKHLMQKQRCQQQKNGKLKILPSEQTRKWKKQNIVNSFSGWKSRGIR